MDRVMPESNTSSVSPTKTSTSSGRSSWSFFTVVILLAPVLLAVLVYQLDSFDPAPLPLHELTHPPLTAPTKHDRILQGSEYLGAGELKGPEDIAYDPRSGLIYTTCADGWIKRVTVNESVADSVVESWVNTGGRPLGLVVGNNGEVVVADAHKGLLRISADGAVELLTDEAEGQKFKLADGVDIADDGTIYFTDASYKYNLEEDRWDILGGRPHGRFLSYDPVTKQTKVLARDLYFANGVAVSPQQDYVVFCESAMRRCKKYYIQGDKKGRIEKFLDNLPGMPDNIHYSQGHYWIGFPTVVTTTLDLALSYPIIRKAVGVLSRYVSILNIGKNAGVFVVDMEGRPAAQYGDPGLVMITSGVQIGNHLYCGSTIYPHILRLNLAKYPAVVAHTITESNTASVASTTNTSPTPVRRRSSWPLLSSVLLAPVLVAALVYQLDPSHPAPLPIHELTQPPLTAPSKNGRMLQGSEYVGAGKLKGPEDIAYDAKSGLIYATCGDGWIKRVTHNESVVDSVVESWVNTGGRPLGIVLGHHGEVIVADAYKGLLRVGTDDGEVELLTDEAEGQKFNLADGVSIADDGTIYFTDASYKYNLQETHLDFLEGRPNGRLLSYDPVTRQTKVLARDLYFPNGLAVSPNQDYVEISAGLELTLAYPFIRKASGIISRYIGPINLIKNAGVFVVDKEGKPAAHYYDPGLAMITAGVQIGTHLYCGSTIYPHIVRLNLAKYPAQPTT
ncbi:hypothetical protein Tsubulata_041454 [Turnera subulata]|uniref:Strictosidine synthase conserved region domain-containing protein n=1 Tax=Turnera subulata TaxID=218843 RepID=A0A9Q0JL88_9ROSI|nr:hypothetical protein Tsubulata_041454 [Turnera subulata]